MTVTIAITTSGSGAWRTHRIALMTRISASEMTSNTPPPWLRSHSTAVFAPAPIGIL
jgi:hypothetical protein